MAVNEFGRNDLDESANRQSIMHSCCEPICPAGQAQGREYSVARHTLLQK